VEPTPSPEVPPIVEQHEQTMTPPELSQLPKMEPRTFTIQQVWTQPLVGTDTMAWLPGETPKLFVPCEGNLVATLDLQGDVLQKISPEGLLEDSIIMNIQAVNFQSGNPRIGIQTLDGKFYLLDEEWKLLATHDAESDEAVTRQIRDVRFMQHQAEVRLLLGIQQDSVQENTAVHSVIRTVDLQGTERWEYFLEGMPHQVSTAVLNDQNRVLVSHSIGRFDFDTLCRRDSIRIGGNSFWSERVLVSSFWFGHLCLTGMCRLE